MLFRQRRHGRDAHVTSGPTLPLKHVVEVGQVDQRQRRVVTCDPRGSPRRRSSRVASIDVAGPQNLNSGNWPSSRCSCVAQLRRVRPDVRQLAPVGGVHRPRRDGVVRRRVHRVPPEQVRAGERRVELLARRPRPSAAARARLDCRQNFTSHSSRKYQPLPTMPCSLGQLAGEVGRLHRRRDGGEHRTRSQRDRPSRANARQPRRVLADQRGVSPTALMTTVFFMPDK